MPSLPYGLQRTVSSHPCINAVFELNFVAGLLSRIQECECALARVSSEGKRECVRAGERGREREIKREIEYID
jgi:hypothetical protein